MSVDIASIPAVVPNWIDGAAVNSSSGRKLPVIAPATGEVKAEVPLSTSAELDQAVEIAKKAQRDWAAIPVKDRVQVFFRYKALLEENLDALAELVTLENGKTIAESKGSVLRGVECVEFATSLPQLILGQNLEVGRGIECKSFRQPVGVVAGITPFNFPAMVPMWMYPLAIACGNAFILKPSEITPLSAIESAKLLEEAGLPKGIFSVVNGDREIVEAICDHKDIKSVGFVGSTKVAKLVYERCASKGKRVRALGGAKNHLVIMPDADPEMTASNIVASFSGCAGQRCMAASVVIALEGTDHIIERVRELSEGVVAGKNLGPLITKEAHERITGYIDRAEQNGVKILLDGRKNIEHGTPGGYWLGPTIMDHCPPDHEVSCNEIFGPTLSIIRAKDLDAALEIENTNPYGNAAAIYTTDGGTAQHFMESANAGMIGVNIGVPVPREPFPFGGLFDSNFGDGDITGNGAIEFWTSHKKVTTKWAERGRGNWMS